MFVIDVCGSVLPSACSWSVGRPLGVSTMATKDAQVVAAYRSRRAWSLSAAAAPDTPGGTSQRTVSASAIPAAHSLRMLLSLRRRWALHGNGGRRAATGQDARCYPVYDGLIMRYQDILATGRARRCVATCGGAECRRVADDRPSALPHHAGRQLSA